MHLERPTVSILISLLLCTGCSWSAQRATVAARLPATTSKDPKGLAEELFAERLDQTPRLADTLESKSPRATWGREGEWSTRPAFERLAGIRVARIDSAIEIADEDERETLVRIRAELRYEALEPALTRDRDPLGPLRGFLRTGLLHLFLDHPIERGTDLEAYRARLQALVTWTEQAAEHSSALPGSMAPLPSTLAYLERIASPPFADLMGDRVAKRARMAMELTPSSRLQTLQAIDILLRSSLPMAAKKMLAVLEAPNRTQPRRGLARQAGGLSLYKKRIKQLVSANDTVSEIDNRLTIQSRELEADLLQITEAIDFTGGSLELLAQIREQYDQSVKHPPGETARLELLTQQAMKAAQILGPLLPINLEELPTTVLLPKALLPLTDGVIHQQAHHGRGQFSRVWVDPSRLHAAVSDSLAVHWILGAAAVAHCDGPTSELPRWLRHAEWPGWNEALGLYLVRLQEEVHPRRDPWQRAAGIGLELECTARGLTDLGLHVHGWSRAEAIEFLQRRSISDRAQVELWVDDCFDRPGLALATPLTLQQILAARAELRQRQGVTFDLLAFHRALLEVGPLPVDLCQSGILRRGR